MDAQARAGDALRHPVDQVQLGFEEIDVVLLVLHQPFELVARDIILDRMAIGRRFLIEVARIDLGGEIAIEHLLHGLADAQRVEHLQIGEALEKDDALDQLVGVMHFLDRFRLPFLGEIAKTPIVEQPVMQPVLIDGGQFVAQPLVQIFDDLGVALHASRS